MGAAARMPLCACFGTALPTSALPPLRPPLCPAPVQHKPVHHPEPEHKPVHKPKKHHWEHKEHHYEPHHPEPYHPAPVHPEPVHPKPHYEEYKEVRAHVRAASAGAWHARAPVWPFPCLPPALPGASHALPCPVCSPSLLCAPQDKHYDDDWEDKYEEDDE